MKLDFVNQVSSLLGVSVSIRSSNRPLYGVLNRPYRQEGLPLTAPLAGSSGRQEKSRAPGGIQDRVQRMCVGLSVTV